MRITVWLTILLGLGFATFSGRFGYFEYFWLPWEFLAATSAAAYNLFAIFVFVVPQTHHGAIDDLLKSGWKILVAIVRFATPLALFSLIALQLLPGQTTLHLSWNLRQRLIATMIAFSAMLIGDAIIYSRLRAGVTSAPSAPRELWRSEIRTLMNFVQVPFIASYIALLYVLQHAHDADPRTIEAFVGGAAAFEVIVQNTIHAAIQLHRPSP